MISHLSFFTSFCHIRPQKWNNEESKKIKVARIFNQNVNQTELPGAAVQVIDGSALLHLVQWLSNSTYSGVIKQYREYVLAGFSQCTVIFDGYDNGPSAKD